jgi:methyl-accepting chemotaxis protein
MTKLGEEISILGEKTSEAFSKSLDENGKIISQKVVESMEGILKEIFVIMDEFKENEKMLAKTIVMLPDQLLTYHETASAQINKQLDDVKRLLRNN